MEKYTVQEEFAGDIKKTDNYYVIITRNNLYNLPYSVDAIFEIKYSGKYGKMKKVYNSFKKMYGKIFQTEYEYGGNQVLIVEDAKSGFQFFDKVCEGAGNTCVSAKGKGNIIKQVEVSADQKVMIIADGAAFGAEMANIYGLSKDKGIAIFLPESFEWLILRSGIIRSTNLKDILENPYDFIESREYFSWEQFFTSYLIKISNSTKYQYSKEKSNYSEPPVSI